ncbi:GH3 family domain-containing protein [Cesiribacter andamanensis]|uniref:GH3 auxin-responsive promoter n=1 Tax=Cesiribacter andamanensis AMV16 TaxID=1279009 RepID=M7NXI4_9BACT|nr:GH3 auxin-responsive promoter family protein [Cesiribacter andamanensis]EMR03124.1 GH3 auxin-responsive promoter [Cesiribacter andamanensis AMV16]
MALLGKIIKSAIELTEKVLPESSPLENQQEVLVQLLKEARDTAFGRQYQFARLLEAEDPGKAFAEAVPFHDYDKMHKEWWQRQLAGEADVTWPGSPSYYALSSGTTGKSSKRIPVTDEMLKAIRKTGVMQILALANFDLPADFYDKEVMMLSSSTDLVQAGDHLEGEISGISASNIPAWFKGFYRPGDEIASLNDWDERVARIAQQAKDWDVGGLSGIPTWNELMLKKIIEYHKLKHIHELWPNLSVFTSGGVAFEPYRKSFEALLGHPITIIDTYLASEGFLAYQNRPNEAMAMKLATNSGIYFEFVPFKPENIDEQGNPLPQVKALRLDEVEAGQDYALIISTVSGAWRYLIGDTVRFTDVERAEIIISGRTKHFLNVVGSQLSVLKMNEAIQALEKQFDLAIPEFTVAAVKPEQEYIHHWYLGLEGQADEEALARELDAYLQEANKNYGVARSRALKGVKVTAVSPDVFYAWNEQEKKMGGQVKMPRVMKEEEFAKWQKFADAQGQAAG